MLTLIVLGFLTAAAMPSSSAGTIRSYTEAYTVTDEGTADPGEHRMGQYSKIEVTTTYSIVDSALQSVVERCDVTVTASYYLYFRGGHGPRDNIYVLWESESNFWSLQASETVKDEDPYASEEWSSGMSQRQNYVLQPGESVAHAVRATADLTYQWFNYNTNSWVWDYYSHNSGVTDDFVCPMEPPVQEQ